METGDPVEVLLVSHGAAIKVLMINLLHLKYQFSFSTKLQSMLESIMKGKSNFSVAMKRVKVENCCISKVSIGLEDGQGVITAYGEAIHLSLTSVEGENPDAELSEAVERRNDNSGIYFASEKSDGRI
jgi:broad specificity phosphatase PhoE